MLIKLVHVLLVLFPIVSFSQTNDKGLTQAEQLTSQAGQLIETQFIEVGKLRELEIKVLKFIDLQSNQSYTALRFELKLKSAYSNDTKIASLDLDEIDDLVQAIKNFQTNVFPTKREVYTEVSYRSKTGFEAGAYYNLTKGNWTSYIQLDKYGRDSLMFLSIDDFQTLLNYILKAKEKMK